MSDWKWPDARGWIGIGIFAMSIMVLWMYAEYPELREDKHFQALMVIIISSGFVGGVVSWAYAATKSGGELADANAAIVKESASAGVAAAAVVAQKAADALPAAGEPTEVKVVNPPSDPANVTEAAPADSGMPDYAR